MKRLQRYLFITGFVLLGGVLCIIALWSFEARMNSVGPFQSKTDEYRYEICSAAKSAGQVVVEYYCFFDSCSYTFFDSSGILLGSAAGDGSMAGEEAARARYIKEDCRDITSDQFEEYRRNSPYETTP